MNNAPLLDQMNFIPKPSILSYDFPQRQRFFDLWEILMNEFRAYEIAKLIAEFARIETIFKLGNLDKYTIQDGADSLDQNLRYAIAECRGAEMPNAEEVIRRGSYSVAQNKHDLSRLRGELDHAKQALISELQKRKFLYLSPNLSSYLDQKALFGDAVFQTFVNAREDIKEAGNCLPADCNTAAVFHLMRAVEHGLRAVATRLKVEVTDKKTEVPLEYADWSKLIDGINIKIKELRKLPNAQEKEKSLEVYSDIVNQAEHIKDLWRNNICHSRRTFNSKEALGIMERIQSFMQRAVEIEDVL